jgi:hypothetical protein
LEASVRDHRYKKGVMTMGLFKKWFGQETLKREVYPEVPEGMKGVFMKGIGMH